jgi:tellurite resistance protein TehA-like permease
MATAIIALQTTANTTADISLAPGSTIIFTLIGALGAGEFIIINKKNSDATYRKITEERPDGKMIDSILSNEFTSRTIVNNSATTITLQVVKGITAANAGVDQD